MVLHCLVLWMWCKLNVVLVSRLMQCILLSSYAVISIVSLFMQCIDVVCSFRACSFISNAELLRSNEDFIYIYIYIYRYIILRHDRDLTNS
jgi:hypothetical protein